MEMKNLGRDFAAYEDLSSSRLDCVFDHLMDGMAYVTSYAGWKWSDVVHDIGIRLCDLHHQSTVIHGKTVGDIREAADEGKVALVLCLESATPIENELDRIDTLYGDHPGLYKYWFSRPLGHHRRPGRERRPGPQAPPGADDPGYVKGLENPNEFINVVRWMIKHGYSDGEVSKVIGGNAVRLLERVW